MRINKFIAHATGLSRRAADAAIEQGRVLVNGIAPQPGQAIGTGDSVSLDGKPYAYDSLSRQQTTTVMLNKPVGYVSAQPEDDYLPAIKLLTEANYFGEGRPAVEPIRLRGLAPTGRLDIESQGLLIFTQDGRVARPSAPGTSAPTRGASTPSC